MRCTIVVLNVSVSFFIKNQPKYSGLYTFPTMPLMILHKTEQRNDNISKPSPSVCLLRLEVSNWLKFMVFLFEPFYGPCDWRDDEPRRKMLAPSQRVSSTGLRCVKLTTLSWDTFGSRDLFLRKKLRNTSIFGFGNGTKNTNTFHSTRL